MTQADRATDPAEAIHRGLRAAGVDFVVHLPDSVLSGAMARLAGDPEITTVLCAREDEGIAIAGGAALAGRAPAALMEGSGLGLAGLILARTILHHVPLTIIASHNRLLGEARPFHAATALAAEGTLEGLRIPWMVVDDRDRLATLVEQAAVTAAGQRSVVALLVPPYVMRAAD
jgi:sulfopyruvate decarboxylase TPP-binding subunit